MREIVDYPILHPSRALERAALDETVRYLQDLPVLPPSFPTARQLLSFAISQSPSRGSAVELGVYKGATIRFIARQFGPSRSVHGFDTFTGLPTRWTGNFAMFDARGRLPRVPTNVELHVGLFSDTVPAWAATNSEQVALVHVDCDIYESARSGLDGLAPAVGEGTIIVFDEYFNYPGWQEHEFKAFQEFIESQGLIYSYIGYSRIQAAMRIESRAPSGADARRNNDGAP